MTDDIAKPGFIAVYRWRVPADAEAQFREVWRTVTLAARERGALGSTLTKDANGEWVAIALWQSEQQRIEVFAQIDGEFEGLPAWPEIERLSEAGLTIIDDLWARSSA